MATARKTEKPKPQKPECPIIVCAWCKKNGRAISPKSKFCTQACRLAAYRERHETVEKRRPWVWFETCPYKQGLAGDGDLTGDSPQFNPLDHGKEWEREEDLPEEEALRGAGGEAGRGNPG